MHKKLQLIPSDYVSIGYYHLPLLPFGDATFDLALLFYALAVIGFVIKPGRRCLAVVI